MSSPDLAIDVADLTKRFGTRTVVDRLSIQVERGRICGFLGPNGSGKTTTLRMLCGLLTPDGGRGTCLGHDILREAAQIKRRVGYMTQRFGLYEELTIEENLAFIARVYQLPRPRAAADRALDRLGLGARRDQLAGTLSGGWKQRLALAACLLHEPQLLLLDEPTAGVDPKARRDFWHHIHALAADGMTVLVSTHYMDEAERCHRIAYLSFGRLIVSGRVDEVLAGASLSTWRVSGPDLSRLVALADADSDWMTAAFGVSVHVTSARRDDFPQWLDARVPGHAWTVERIDAGLEDLFIALMADGSRATERVDA